MSQLIDGKALAKKIRENIKKEVLQMTIKPGLAVVLVGDDPASQIYVNSKEKACLEVGFYSKKIILPENTTETELLQTVDQLNNDQKIHGILIQLPLPKQINEEKIIDAIKPEKDADCLHKYNIGQLLFLNNKNDFKNFLIPCTPKGIMEMIETTGQTIAGKKAVVVGRSNIVGKPIELLLLAKDATVSVCHSKTTDLKKECLSADILVAAVGRSKMITVDMIKKGAIVIDAGINRDGKKITGDVDFEKAKEITSFITPVPGGVGPMTIACLLENTLLLAKRNL